MVTRLIISSLAVLITALTLDGVTVEPWWWAVIKFLALPINLLTLGLFTLVINGAMVMLCSWLLSPHFEVAGLGWAICFSLVLMLVSWMLHLFFPAKSKSKKKK